MLDHGPGQPVARRHGRGGRRDARHARAASDARSNALGPRWPATASRPARDYVGVAPRRPTRSPGPDHIWRRVLPQFHGTARVRCRRSIPRPVCRQRRAGVDRAAVPASARFLAHADGHPTDGRGRAGAQDVRVRADGVADDRRGSGGGTAGAARWNPTRSLTPPAVAVGRVGGVVRKAAHVCAVRGVARTRPGRCAARATRFAGAGAGAFVGLTVDLYFLLGDGRVFTRAAGAFVGLEQFPRLRNQLVACGQSRGRTRLRQLPLLGRRNALDHGRVVVLAHKLALPVLVRPHVALPAV